MRPSHGAGQALNVIMLGPPGAGKGTQAERLARGRNLPKISTGDILREAVHADTEMGRAAKITMDAGNLVSDDVMIGIVRERLEREDARNGFVLDGFPRNDAQAAELERVLDGHPLDLVVNLDVSTDIVLDRIAGRRVCENCGATYHVKAPPKHDWTCDVCGGKVVHRSDDTEEAVRRRLELYDQETVPLIDFYRQLRKLEVVDGEGDGDEVFKRLVTAIDSRLS